MVYPIFCLKSPLTWDFGGWSKTVFSGQYDVYVALQGEASLSQLNLGRNRLTDTLIPWYNRGMGLREKSKSEWQPIPLYIDLPPPSREPPPAQVREKEQRGAFEINMNGGDDDNE